MDKHTEKAIQGAAMAPLSKDQKKSLVLLARRAFNVSQKSTFDNHQSAISFDSWRHSQQLQAVERSSLCTCTNEDFLFLKAHYLRILGEEEKAGAVRVKASVEPRIWALARLQQECEAVKEYFPGAYNYASGFLRNARKIDIDHASEKQIWHAIYIVRRRSAQLRRSASAIWRKRQEEKIHHEGHEEHQESKSSSLRDLSELGGENSFGDDSDLTFP